MLEKLAQQTAVYGLSTIIVRFLSYLLTPFYTRVFGTATYGIIVDVYALIPLALVVLTLGMESAYFRFAAKADEAGRAEGESDPAAVAQIATAAKQRLYSTSWSVTTLAALLFFAAVAAFRAPISAWMGEAYTAHTDYVVWVAAIVLLDVAAAIPYARLREQGRAVRYMALRAVSVVVNFALAVGFYCAGFFDTSFGVGWVLVANAAASGVTLLLALASAGGVQPRIDRRLLGRLLVYSLPLLLSGIAGTANEFIDRQMLKFLLPEGAMGTLGIYGALLKVGVVMMLFTQIYRLAAEPFFLADYKKQDFVQMNAAALQYYVLVSMAIFLGVALFRDLFALIVGRDFRGGIGLLPVVLMGNVLSGVWLNLSFWYKREERTQFALLVTLTGLACTVALNRALIPHWGYYGSAWARLVSEAAMVGVSYWLNRRYFPTPYRVGRMVEYVVVALALFGAATWAEGYIPQAGWRYALHGAVLLSYLCYACRREAINPQALLRAMIRRGAKK